jgi:uncharacterized protein with GYD domain
MPTFILSLSWTDQGIRAVKDAPKRAQAARELAQKVGVEIKEVYLTSGDTDLLVIVDTPNGGQRGKIRARARVAGKRADAHRPGLGAIRISKADIRASVAATDVEPVRPAAMALARSIASLPAAPWGHPWNCAG